jgi:hypothetical protein
VTGGDNKLLINKDKKYKWLKIDQSLIY